MSRPFRVLGLVAQGVEIGDREQIGRAQRLTDITLALNLAHAQGVAADIEGALGQ